MVIFNIIRIEPPAAVPELLKEYATGGLKSLENI